MGRAIAEHVMRCAVAQAIEDGSVSQEDANTFSNWVGIRARPRTAQEAHCPDLSLNVIDL